MLKKESKCEGVALVLSTNESGTSTQLSCLLHTRNKCHVGIMEQKTFLIHGNISLYATKVLKILILLDQREENEQSNLHMKPQFLQGESTFCS